MAKTTTRKKTKTSGRSSGGGKKAGPAGKSASSHRKAQPARARKAAAKPAKKTPKAKKAAHQTTTRTAARKTTSKKTKSKSAAKKSQARTTSKKSAARKTSRAHSADRAAKTAAPKKAPAAKKVAKPAPIAGAKKNALTAPAPSKRGAAKGHEAAAKPPEIPKVPLPTVEEALAQLPYHEGQFVVHPKYGLGKVDRITERKLSTRTVPCLEISFSYQEMRLTIPVDQVERSGLRRPISRREIDEVFKALKGRATFDAKRRSAKRVVDYRKRLNLGDPISLAEAIRDLGRLSLKKSLSYEERKILSTALRILSREVALARGREPDDVREEIEKIVYR